VLVSLRHWWSIEVCEIPSTDDLSQVSHWLTQPWSQVIYIVLKLCSIFFFEKFRSSFYRKCAKFLRSSVHFCGYNMTPQGHRTKLVLWGEFKELKEEEKEKHTSYEVTDISSNCKQTRTKIFSKKKPLPFSASVLFW